MKTISEEEEKKRKKVLIRIKKRKEIKELESK